MSNRIITPGERLIDCLTGKKTDRTPFGVGIGWWPWGETIERWKQETKNPKLDIFKELGYDYSYALPEIVQGMQPVFPRQVLKEDADTVTYRNEAGITLRNRKDGGSMPEFMDYPVKNEADWEKLKTERFKIEPSKRITQDWKAFKEKVKTTGEAVQVGNFPYGVFGSARDLLGAEELLVSFYERPEMIKDIMNHMTAVSLAVFEEVSKEVRIDHIHIWEDMSGKQGSLLSPQMVEEFMMPCYDRIAEFAKSKGVRVISVDTDGDCAELVPIMMKHGVNMFFPFEVQAGNDIREYRKKYPELGIVGGLNKNSLAGTKADIDIEVKKAGEMLKYGRYIPGFDHLIPPDVSWEKFKYAAEKIKELCYKS